jgi:lipoyl-dependent peroxiredoxin
MDTTAAVTRDQVEGGFSSPPSILTLKATIFGADQATFEKLAGMAKAGYPISTRDGGKR